jgi:hypothetical protein
VGSVEDEVALGQDFARILQFSPENYRDSHSFNHTSCARIPTVVDGERL